MEEALLSGKPRGQEHNQNGHEHNMGEREIKLLRVSKNAGQATGALHSEWLKVVGAGKRLGGTLHELNGILKLKQRDASEAVEKRNTSEQARRHSEEGREEKVENGTRKIQTNNLQQQNRSANDDNKGHINEIEQHGDRVTWKEKKKKKNM